MALIDDIQDLVRKTEKFYDKTKKLERVLLGQKVPMGDGSEDIVYLNATKQQAFKDDIKTKWQNMKDAWLALNF